MVAIGALGLYVVAVEGGGVVPKELSGSWNRRKQIDAAILAYEVKRDKPKRSYHKARGNTDGKGTN